MSILSEQWGDLVSLLFPARCAVCGSPLVRGERTVCTLCRATAPLTGYWAEADNPVFRKCWGLVPLHRASGFLFFVHGSGWRQLIHGFKYRGAWRTAREMGEWYGACLAEGGLYDDVMTTGSTLLSCAAEILRAAPGCRVSIAALAVPRRELGLRE